MSVQITKLVCQSCFASLETEMVQKTASVECDYCGVTHIYEIGSGEIQSSVFNQQNQRVTGTQVNVVHGDVVHGDSFSGDKVGGRIFSGDKIVVGNISGQKRGVAIGRGATSIVIN